MSNKNINIVDNVEKYTVKDFCEEYNKINDNDARSEFIYRAMNLHYVSYEMKITICKKIIENSYYKKNDDGTKKLYINSPAKHMLCCLYLVKQYTNIIVDFSDTLKDFNLLNEHGLINLIFDNIQEKELKEFYMVLDMVENDVLKNEYETHAFISNQIERFGELTGFVLKPAVEQLSNVLENMDEKTIDKITDKLKRLNGLNGIRDKFDKFNIIK